MDVKNKRHETSRHNRQKIISAALEIFIKDGFEGARIEDICLASGASVGSIYHYFGDKAGLAESVYLKALEEYLKPLYAALQHDVASREFISIIVQHHLTWVRDNQKWARILFPILRSGRTEKFEAKIAALNKKYLGRSFDLLDQYAKAGEIKTLPRYLYAPLIMGPCQELARQFLENRRNMISPDAGALLSEVIWQGLRAER